MNISIFFAIYYALSNRDGDFWKTARGENVAPDRVRGRLALWKHKLPTELDIKITNLLFTEWSYLYVFFGKNFIDDVECPLKGAEAWCRP